MPQSPLRQTWVRRHACETDRRGIQCIGDDEVLTHHTKQKGSYDNAPRPSMLDETEISVRRGKLTVAEASVARNAGNPVHPSDVAAAGVRYTSAGDLREAGFAVIHTPGIKGEESGHVSVIWPNMNPLDEQDRVWPAEVQAALAACFTEEEG